MTPRVLTQALLSDTTFWEGKDVELPAFDRDSLPIRGLAFSTGNMAYGHTADIMQDLIHANAENCGTIAGIETFDCTNFTQLSATDYLATQCVYENKKGVARMQIQGAIPSILFCNANPKSLCWQRACELMRSPQLQFGTINAPEGAYGMTYDGGEYAHPVSAHVKADMQNGTITSDAGRWTALAYERYNAGLNFALVSCTNFPSNGLFTAATVKTMARAWKEKGLVESEFLEYLSDPSRFSFPNTMIDRIAVPPDDNAYAKLHELGITSNLIVTEEARYWAVEDAFPAGRPAFEQARGVFMVKGHDAVQQYEDIKLRLLNMSHSVIAGIGVLLGYRRPYGIYEAMQDKEITDIISTIMKAVLATIQPTEGMSAEQFAEDTIRRLNNPNIPDNPLRIALNASTKMVPRFLNTYFAACEQGLDSHICDTILLPVAGFLRYTLAKDDEGNQYELQNDPIKERLLQTGEKATLGDPASAAVFADLIRDTSVMGKDLFSYGDAGKNVQNMLADMLAQKGGVRKTVHQHFNQGK